MDSVTASIADEGGARRAVTFGAVDVLVIAIVLGWGLVSHGTNPITAPLSALETIVPFAVGWLLAAGVARPYDQATLRSPVETARLATVTWLAAANVGLVLRTSSFVEGDVAWPFGLVVTATGLVALLVWRVGYATVVGS